jgi:putative endonuclease
MKPIVNKGEVGRLGEKYAARYLRRHGFRILARNVHCGKYELDLIAQNRKTLLFVEVKTRSFSSPNEALLHRPSEAVDAAKRERTLLAARAYLREHHSKRCPRIDVIEVYLDREKRLKPFRIHHIEDAISSKGDAH